MSEEFVNWSGSLRFTPARRVDVCDEDAVVACVQRAAEAGQTVRPVGSGHSSVPLVATDDVLLGVDDLAGLVDHDTGAHRATLRGGTQLAAAGEALWPEGLALENLGDVDYQALAGAFATGTHGTGRTFGNLSTMLCGGRLVTGTGEVVAFDESDEDDSLLRAARVSLGVLGVLTTMRLRVMPAVELRRVTWCTHIDWVLEHFGELIDQHRHADFYWYPRSDLAQVRTVNEVGHEPDLVPPGRVHSDDEGPGHRIIPQSRHLPFEEMEYMVDLDDAMACFREVRKRVRDRHRRTVGWRVLVRTVAADDTMLSNCQGRDTATIALLHNAGLPHEDYFGDMEPLLVDFAGRPHWGKKHTRVAADLRPHYPEWDTFASLRRRLDPQGTFMNPYLTSLLEDDG